MTGRRTPVERDRDDVRPGQVWAAQEPYSEGRTIKVVRVEWFGKGKNRHGHAVCEIATDTNASRERVEAGLPVAPSSVGRTIFIGFYDFAGPGRAGCRYRLVSDA